VIVYEYIEGMTIDFKALSPEEKVKMKTEVKEQLDELHRLGLVHGDVRGPNIILTPNRFLLIDYGRTYSLDGTFPALDFMVTQEDDLTALSVI
jgi:tRNA A-37 threonylcarbamoyl transferase component Bud32